MSFYEVPTNEVMNSLKKVIKMGEKAKISKKVNVDEAFYREVVLSKKSFLSLKKNDSGIVYLDENNNVVTDEKLLKKLGRDFYFYSAFFDESSNNSLINALQNEGDIKRDRKDYNEAIEAADILITEGIKQAELIKTIAEKVLKLREKTNELLNDIMNEYAGFTKENGYLNEKFLEEVNDKYKELMRVNFEKVLIINKGLNIYDDVQDAAHKKKKKLTVRFNTSVVSPMNKLDYVISYFKRIIRTYQPVIHLNMMQYVKHHEKFEKNNVEERLTIIRK
ncbi:hypothetical protein [Oceanirhabdus sp. W0125-5]|uniref:hypothetical protein n=1 Tax=Oceanirhabdus sp. W0125-5 TaxID=2999116 RepID=UPI0022F33AFE|nr:hypothetical protein [Oceanirhabdus sp. W0125-5]WBW99426.1 hypothetical protein OW730_11975 [Oceanirhabdus sp. W0125-5]